MIPPTPLTDRTALTRFRTRAFGTGEGARFLHELAADEVKERLEMVNRTFTDPVVISPLPEFWDQIVPGARHISDEETLDLETGAHDLIVHTMALHWANDPVGQLTQCRHGLRPDGLMLGVMLGGQTLHELRAALAEAEIAVTGGLGARVLPMAEIRDLGSLLQRAGFALPVSDSLSHRVSYRDMFHLMADLRAMGEVNALTARRKTLSQRRIFIEAAQKYTEAFGDDDGRIPATFETIFLTGWAPDASQQQPLRPGSANTRLADALNTQEISLPEGPAVKPLKPE